MKKIVSCLIILTFLLTTICIASEELDESVVFEITDEGELTGYYGGEWVVVPECVNDIPVVKIAEKTFFDLGIDDVYLPDGLTVIGESAFEGSTLKSVEIPYTVKIIGERAFANCDSLYTVFMNIDESTVIGKDAFAGTKHMLFYLDCNVDTKTIERKLLVAKGDDNIEVEIRHVAANYDEDGNVVCNACGYKELPSEIEMSFEDVSRDEWYYKYVQTAYASGILNGKSETLFDPGAGMTCAEAAKIAASIYSVVNEPIDEYEHGAWYEPYVDYCYANGIIEDYIKFDWDKNITRAQMAYLFSRCNLWENFINEVPITDIPDVHDTTPFAYEILDLYNLGIAVGDETMAFHPDDSIKRCEAAALVARMINYGYRVELPKG